jgi:tetratricopeptide (TPR) repeat protein
MKWHKLKSVSLFNPRSKSFLLTGSVLLAIVWWGMDFLLSVIGNPLGTNSKQEEYFLLLSFSSLVVTYLLGYILFTLISIDSLVQSKYEHIMNSLVYDEEGKKIYHGDPRQNFTNAEWVRLSIEQHLDLMEVSSSSEKTKIIQLKLMLENIKPDQNPRQYASTASMLSTKLNDAGDYTQAEEMCRRCLAILPAEHKTAFGQIKAALGVVLKQSGQVREGLNELTNAVEMVTKDDPLLWISVNKALLRTQFLSEGTIPEPSKLEEIHDVLRTLCKSDFGSTNYVDAWRLSAALESFYDLYSLFLSVEGQLQWALRYSYAAVVLAENRTGLQSSTYSTSHLSRLLMLDGDYQSAMIMLDNKRAYLEERGESRGWLSYNLARCKFGTGEFDDAVELYNETIAMKNSDAYIILKAHIGLSYAYKRLGNTKRYEEAKQKAEHYAKQTGLNAVWQEPNTSVEDTIEEPAEKWVVNQVKMTWMDSMKQAKKELGLTDTRFAKKGTEYYDRTKEIYNSTKSE